MVALETVAVLLLSGVMFIASFSAGTVPLAMSLSQEKMNKISSLGVGLLVGTSLGVVLPEGIEMLYSSMESISLGEGHNLRPRAEHTIPDAVSHRASAHPESDHSHHSYHLAVGLSLVTGYIVMHLLTFLPPLLLSKKSHAPIPLSSLPSSPRLERTPSGTIIEAPTGLSNTTIGLCIHALADGIALGSSAVSSNLALEGIVFFAIMLHKVSKSLLDAD
jgi:solute carrier family 39 (zinc transporter), member 9